MLSLLQSTGSSMDKRARVIELRPANKSDFEFAWKAWAEAVEPHISPIIKSKFNRAWKDSDEQKRFSTWWQPEQSLVVTLDEMPIGWMAAEEKNELITLINFVILQEYRYRGIGYIVLGAKLHEWASKFKTVAHSVLKTSGHKSFFERLGFKVIREDDIVVFMEASIN
jgi:hypothetical protein